MLFIKLKVIFKRLQEILYLRFYLTPNYYKVSYEINVENFSINSEKISLIAPIAKNLSYQKIYKTTITPTPNHQKCDKKYNNNYAIWEENLLPNEKKKFLIEYKIKISPRKNIFNKTKILNRKLKDYFITPNSYILPLPKELKEWLNQIKENVNNDINLLKSINKKVIKLLTYGNPINGLYTSTKSVQKKEVDCGGFSSLIVAMAREVKIPARIVSGFWCGYDDMKNNMHAWCEAYLPNNGWIPFDASTEKLFYQGRMWNSGKFNFLGADRITMSIGEDIPLEVNDEIFHTDILQNPITICDNKKDISVKLEYKSKIISKKAIN